MSAARTTEPIRTRQRRDRGRSAPRHRASPTTRDDGFTLVELTVAMGIFTVLMTLVLVAVVGLARTTARVQNVADASDQLRTAFLTMDRQVRYADAVNFPGTTGTGAAEVWWVEAHTSAVAADTQPTCTQWRFTPSTGVLDQRSWPDGGPPGPTWRVVASQLLADPDQSPFTLVVADLTYSQQELDVHLRSGRSDTAAGGRSGLDSRFVARNSSASSPGNSDADKNKVSDSPTCGPLSKVRS